MIIALDGMGGDKAPDDIVHGAVKAKDLDVKIALVGPYSKLHSLLEQYPAEERNHIEIHHAPQVVEMADPPTWVFKEKKDSSIAMTVKLVADKKADAAVSAGNSGAFMAAAVRFLRTPGIARPAIGAILPGLKGKVILVDAGANIDCQPRHLLDFAIMGEAYMKAVEKRPNPAIGLVSIGEEPNKGTQLVRRAHDLLKRSQLNFVGNIEGRDFFSGRVDVVVTDGFTGNVVLKGAEGIGKVLKRVIYREFPQGTIGKIALIPLYPSILRIQKSLDYHEYGGAPLLGVEGVCIVGHGSSNARAIYVTIQQAREMVSSRVYELIKEKIREEKHRGFLFGRDHRGRHLQPEESPDE
ncbi:MAG: phosphate acyltransferase PlsX [bacterium]